MTTAVKAIYEDGVFKPLESFHLDELTQVEVLIPCLVADETDRVRCDDVNDLIGFIKNAPPDMAERHDRYLSDLPAK